MANITEALRELARSRPDAAAFVLPDDRTLSYAALDRQIDAAARRILALGLRPGQIVGLAINGPNEALALTVALALARLGIASAEPNLTPHRLAGVLVQPGERLPPGCRIAVFDTGWLEEAAPAPVLPIDGGGAKALRIFATSGSTGRPNFCAVSHADMLVRITGRGYPIDSPDWPPVLVCAMGVGGHAGFRGVLTALLAGGTLVFTNPANLITAILRHRVTVLALSPRTLQEVVDRAPAGLGPLPALRALRVSGSQLPAPLARVAAERLCPNVITTFGATETGNICSGRHDAFPDEPLAIGEILPDVAVEAVDEDDRPLPPGVEGVLRFRAPGMCTGYLDDPDGTGSHFRDGWFYSGDRGTVTAARVLLVSGRTGEFINSGGVKTSPRVIEAALLAIPGVREAAAFAAPDLHGLARIWAAIVPAAPIDAGVLSRECAARLGPAAPRHIMQMQTLPRNENGKVLVRDLVAFATGFLRDQR